MTGTTTSTENFLTLADREALKSLHQTIHTVKTGVYDDINKQIEERRKCTQDNCIQVFIDGFYGKPTSIIFSLI